MEGSEKESKTSKATWIDLPSHLTDLILERLNLHDYLRFGAVCRRWRSIQSDHRLRYSPGAPPTRQSFPWILPLISYPNQKPFSCFSLSGSTLNRLHIPTPSGFVFSTSRGWLFIFTNGDDHMQCQSQQSAYLLNPISGARIQLPPIPTPHRNPTNAVLSASPADPDSMALIIDYTRASPISVCRVHDNGEWIKIHVSWEDNTNGLSCSAVFCGGKFYCFCHRSFVVIDPLFPLPRTIKLEMNHTWRKLGGQSHYLVESNADVLLVVAMHGAPVVRIKDFQVFRADFSRMLWVLVEALDDRVLFIDAYSSFSLSTAEVGCKNFGPFY